MTTVATETITAGAFPTTVRVRAHTFTADVGEALGGTDSSPGPHDLFDAALATCKAMTALWYAKRKGIPLERVSTVVESSNAEERQGVYKLTVKVELHGPMTDDQRAAIHKAIAACPIHKLMTTSDVQIETVE